MTKGQPGVREGTGLLRTDPSDDLVLRRVLVRVATGAERGREVILEDVPVVVGSHPGADLVLEDRTVSRYHTELSLRPGGVQVRDLGSTNGTFVGSSRIEQAIVMPAAELVVGRTRIELLPADAPAPLVPSAATSFGALVGETPEMRRVFAMLERVAPSDVPVLIEGEPGVGKSEAAVAIHRASPRADRAYVVLDLNDGGPPNHVKAAFAAAQHGTLVFDRIDELAPRLLTTLAAELDARERGNHNARLLTLSRLDLRTQVEAGILPREVYFHLTSVRIVIPPLRERIDDLGRLISSIAHSLGFHGHAPTPADLAPLRAHEFPGNVRELFRFVEHVLVTERRPSVAPPGSALAPEAARLLGLPFKAAKEELVIEFERFYLKALMTTHDGNISRAADAAGLDRTYLTRLIKKLGLRP